MIATETPSKHKNDNPLIDIIEAGIVFLNDRIYLSFFVLLAPSTIVSNPINRKVKMAAPWRTPSMPYGRNPPEPVICGGMLESLADIVGSFAVKFVISAERNERKYKTNSTGRIEYL